VDGETHSEVSANTPGEVRNKTSGSGWTTTKQAAKVLGVSRRSVQGYVRRGLLEAQEQGQGVSKTFLVSIDSLNALHDRRRSEASEAAKFAEASADAVEEANQYTSAGEALRHAIERVEERTAEATEMRIRLELTEQAQSTLREELIEERRRREEAEQQREEMRRELQALREARESPGTVEEQQGRGQAHSATGEAREGAQRPWWRRMFGS
jgi:flagellar hook-basal body complex protein FliE